MYEVKSWMHFWFGVVHFLLGATLLVFGFIKNLRGFVPLSNFDASSGAAPPPFTTDDDDDSGPEFSWGVPGTNQSEIISVSFFIAAAALIESFGLILSSMSYDYMDQVNNRLVSGRWTLWSITQSLAFVCVAYIAGVANVAVIFSIVMITIALNFAQSTNEALHTPNDEAARDRTGYTIGTKYGLEGYLVATLAFVTLLGINLAYLVQGTAYYTGSGNDKAWSVAVVAVVYGLYFILHALILGLLTNFNKIESTFLREFVFLIFQALIFVMIAIGTFVLREH